MCPAGASIVFPFEMRRSTVYPSRISYWLPYILSFCIFSLSLFYFLFSFPLPVARLALSTRYSSSWDIEDGFITH